jgi:hypothetical protein
MSEEQGFMRQAIYCYSKVCARACVFEQGLRPASHACAC